jgi:phosphohistidine phosphatase
VRLFLVHHGDAVGSDVDPQRPLSLRGREQAARAAADAASRGAHPAVIWHSGKLRARQTAEAFRRACNPLAEFTASRDLQPNDLPAWIAERLRGETRDVLLAGHFPYLPGLLTLLLTGRNNPSVAFPPHGAVALESEDEGKTWTELWRIGNG